MNNYQTLQVELGNRSYPIHIGSGMLAESELLRQAIPARQVAIITDQAVAPHYLSPVLDSLGGLEVCRIVLPAGEKSKNLATVEQVYQQLATHRYARDSVLIALGGGVIGDITGFVAATWQRGINFIQIPTTLLAQVDSSVGGKTGVNMKQGKNLIGAFHQPSMVLCDTATLNSLPERELNAGIAEIIKYGLIRDPAFFAWLEENIAALKGRQDTAINYAVKQSCSNKAAIVAADEKEQNIRALLNFGHSFGHAIEASQDYRGLLHGEAVALGMAMAARLSERLQLCTSDEVNRIEALLHKAGLPTVLHQSPSPESLVQLMKGDKKVLDGKLRLILLETIGTAIISETPGDQMLTEAIRHYCD